MAESIKYTVSVIVPTYNRARLVEQTVQSVFDQKFEDLELIVVDDGSTDDSRRALEAFLPHPNFRYAFQENEGRSSARNHGLGLSRGQYVMFLDSDDLLQPGALATLLKVAVATPDSGIIGGDRRFVNENLELIDRFIAMRPQAAIQSEWLNLMAIRDVFFPPSTYLVKRKLAADIRGFDTATEPAEDFDFFVKCCERARVSYVNSVVVHMRRHDGNTENAELRQAAVRIAKANLSRLAASEETAIALWNTRIADDLYAMDRGLEALVYYLMALRSRSSLDVQVRRWVVTQLSKCIIPTRLKDVFRPRD